MHRAVSLAVLFLVATTNCAREAPEPELIDVLAAADRRAVDPADLQLLVGAATMGPTQVRHAAILALGRLERTDVTATILLGLDDPEPEVRAIAAFAAAQSVRGTDGSPLVAAELLAVAREDPDAGVRGAAAAELGRLPHSTVDAATAAATALVELAVAGLAPDAVAPDVVHGATRGIDGLLRAYGRETPQRPRPAPSEELVGALAILARRAGDARARSLALSALLNAGALDPALVTLLLTDEDSEVRRLAVRGLGGEEATIPLRTALADPALTVRIEAWRTARRLLEPDTLCQTALASEADAPPPERLEILALLGDCRGAVPRLAALAGGLAGAGADGWHPGAAALVALAGLDPDRASEHLRTAAGHAVWQVRAHAARATARAAAVEGSGPSTPAAAALLAELARDPVPNVRVAALGPLADLAPDPARSAAAAALALDDPELLLTAARVLETTGSDAPTDRDLLDSLDRITARREETSRDARVALLRAAGAGAPPEPARIDPYLADFDPVVAELAAEILRAGGQVAAVARPEPLAPAPVPGRAELERLSGADWIVEIEGRGTFVIRLWPHSAPTNAARFARLAEEGAFDGLTFHRVVRNFVIQGLSPGASEYAGYPRFTRDEITPRTHARGTVGLSTRGRDTGDGQIFVNLVDNPRLDYEYTLLGEVVEGIDVVDAILEGDVVTAVTRRPSAGR